MFMISRLVCSCATLTFIIMFELWSMYLILSIRVAYIQYVQKWIRNLYWPKWCASTHVLKSIILCDFIRLIFKPDCWCIMFLNLKHISNYFSSSWLKVENSRSNVNKCSRFRMTDSLWALIDVFFLSFVFIIPAQSFSRTNYPRKSQLAAPSMYIMLTGHGLRFRMRSAVFRPLCARGRLTWGHQMWLLDTQRTLKTWTWQTGRLNELS